MKIVVCPLSQVQQMVGMHRPECVVSLLDPESAFPELGAAYRDRHLRLHFHDVYDCAGGLVAPCAEHVQQLVEFVSSWTRSAPILIHCRAGISRSSAAGFISACLHDPELAELTIARSLRNASRLARPNELLIRLADAAMGRNGRMLEAIQETGRDLIWEAAEENSPFELSISARSVRLLQRRS